MAKKRKYFVSYNWGSKFGNGFGCCQIYAELPIRSMDDVNLIRGLAVKKLKEKFLGLLAERLGVEKCYASFGPTRKTVKEMRVMPLELRDGVADRMKGVIEWKRCPSHLEVAVT